MRALLTAAVALSLATPLLAEDWPQFRGANGPGWLVQPAIREELPKVTRDIEAGLSDLIAREIRRARVPRSG